MGYGEKIADHFPLLFAVIALLCLSAFFSGSETAFFSISRSAAYELERGSRKARTAAKLLRDPRKLLVTILFGNLLVNISATSAVTALYLSLYGEKGVGIAASIMTVVILLFGEITPKSLAIKRSLAVAIAAAPVLDAFRILFSPLGLVLGGIAQFTVEASKRFLGDVEPGYGARELAAAVELGHRDGLFDEFEKRVLTKLFLYSELTAREVQTPRHEVFVLDVDTPMAEAVAKVRRKGFSRVPLVIGPSEEIAGMILAKDLLGHSRSERATLSEIMKPVRFVPESKRVRDLFEELVESHQKMVVVVDEHGTFTGIITLEDILEEIFGSMRNIRESRIEQYHILAPGRIVANGTMSIRELNDIFGTDFDSSEVETVAGYLIERIGRIPRDGEAFELGGLRFLVLSAEPIRVNRLKIERLEERP